ncbi:MAG: pirin family protein [Clostridiaceae bacterium]|jgi:redox-sensitive bicupin YhaK (pirin superfamily)|nr:pirin family protein [Clostridiaceae bacterium]
MVPFCKIKKINQGHPAVDGAGVRLVRVIGYRDTADYDPFLMLDAFDSQNPDDYTKGFPWHPHRGIETITYLIQGDIEHGDSLGNSGSILDGECQWMTAGSGIIHQEMPQASPRMLGAQIWLNLPAKDKMTAPRYGDIKAADVPRIETDGAVVRVIAGEYQGRQGAFTGAFIQATYLDVALQAGQAWSFDSDPNQTLFVYLFSGRAIFDPDQDPGDPGQVIDEKQAVLFSAGDRFWVRAVGQDLRFIFLSAPPLREPIAWGGPIVMNTKAELDLAFRELDNGTFLKQG